MRGNKRRRQRRLSIFTDLIIIIVIMIAFRVVLSLVNFDNTSEFKEDNLALEDIDSYNKNYIISEKIYEQFGVKVIYGDDAREDAIRVNASVQADEEIITENLINIYNTFLEYPSDYFKDANLTVIVLNEFSNNNIALASRNSLNQFKIYISNAQEYGRSLNHEMYHVFEYMLDDETEKEIEEIWITLNPDGFKYNSNIYELTDEYVYNEKCNLEDVYFVTKYAKASHKEDRAEVFAEIMTFSDKNQEFFVYTNNPIVTKAKLIIETLKSEYKHSKDIKWDIFK